MSENKELQYSLLREAMKLHEEQKPQLPHGFEDDIMQKIEPKHHHRLVAIFSAVAAVAAIIAVVILVVPRLSTDSGTLATADTLEYSRPLTGHHDADKAMTSTASVDETESKASEKALAESSPAIRKAKVKPCHADDSSRYDVGHAVENNSKVVAVDREETYSADSYSEALSTLPDPKTMFIESSYDNSALSANRDRMVRELGLAQN